MWKKDKPDSKGDLPEEYAEGDTQEPAVPRTESGQGVNAFVGKGVEFKGIISYNGTVRIDGALEGEIHTEGTLLVGQEAVINAKVTAGTIICKGKITGDIEAKEKVKLRSPAVLNGSVTAPMLSMEEGVFFNGNCTMSQPSGRDQREKVLHSVGQQGTGLKRSTA